MRKKRLLFTRNIQKPLTMLHVRLKQGCYCIPRKSHSHVPPVCELFPCAAKKRLHQRQKKMAPAQLMDVHPAKLCGREPDVFRNKCIMLFATWLAVMPATRCDVAHVVSRYTNGVTDHQPPRWTRASHLSSVDGKPWWPSEWHGPWGQEMGLVLQEHRHCLGGRRARATSDLKQTAGI